MAYGSVNTPGVSASELNAVKTLAQDAKNLAQSASDAITDFTNTINIIPSASETLVYTGSQQSPTWLNYDANKLTIGGTTQATDAGTYSATFTPKSGFKWSDGTSTAKTVQWTIDRAAIAVPTVSSSLTYTGSAQSPTWTGYDSSKMTLGGTSSGINAGTYGATFTPTANYKWADNTTAAKTVNWTIAKAAGSLSLNPTNLTLNNSTKTGTITVTRAGDGAITAISGSTGVATVSVSGNTITVTGKATGTTTVTVKVAAGTNHKAPADKTCAITVNFVNIYGVSWDGTSTTKWSRTDNAAGFTDPVPYVAGASSYSSPFDNLQPWAGMTKSTRSGNVVVAIPKFWYKITKSGSGMKIQIADQETAGFSVSPAHMNRGDGAGERDVVYIGRYHCGTSGYKSVSGQKPKVSITRSNARSSIHGLGANIWQMDFAMRFTIWLLYIVEFADWNSQAKIGYGCGNGSAVQNMGASDSMPYHTGTMQSSRTAYGVGTQYRNIEDLWGNCYDWMDGCYYNSGGMNLILNPANFSDSSGGTSVGTPSNGYPSAFNVSTTGGFPMFYPTAASGSDSTYSCDSWVFVASSPCLYVGGYYGQSTNHGLFYVNYNSTSNANDNIGCRTLLCVLLTILYHGTGSRAPLGEDKQFRERVSTLRKERWKARKAKRRKYVPVKRAKNLFEPLISDENLSLAIDEVNHTHHWRTHHRPNRCTAWVEETKSERIEELRRIIIEGFEPKPPHVTQRWDVSARKWRTVSEPAQWPDQYVHHALIQILQPVFMRGMDHYCCGSIRGRGPHHARAAIGGLDEKRPERHEVRAVR